MEAPTMLFSFRTLGLAWAGMAATAVAAVVALQTSYVPPAPAVDPAPPPPPVAVAAEPAAPPAPLPFENRSLLAALPASHAIPVHSAAQPLPIPPVPPAPHRVARMEPPRHPVPMPDRRLAPAYASFDARGYEGWGWGQPYAYAGQPYYGWSGGY